MAASLLHAAASSSPLAGPNPTARPLASSPFLRLARSSPDLRRRCRIDARLRALPAGGPAPRARRLVLALAAEEPATSSEPGDDAEKENIEIEPEEAQEVLLEASEKLKIQADKAQKDLSVIAAEVGEEGQEYLKLAAQNSPDSIKDITETINALGKLNGPSEYADYHVGIPFGTYLTVGGFLNFMLTGSVSALRFGFVLGFALLALGISSLRSQRAGGRQPRLLLKGQAAIASVIFFRELSIFFQRGWFPNIFVVLLSGLVAAFYVHRIVTGGHKGPSTQSGSEN